MKETVKQQIYLYGETVVFHRLTVNQLRTICDDMHIEGAENTASKRILIEAITTGTEIPARAAPKRTKITKKKSIEKATEYLELFQHYKASDLESWCKDNGLKTSGTKKVLCERILAYKDGDTENTMATNTSPKNKRKTKKPKKASLPPKGKKKAEPEPESESEQDEEPEAESESEVSAVEQSEEEKSAEQPEAESEQDDEDTEGMEVTPPSPVKSKKTAGKKGKKKAAKPVKVPEPEPEPESESEQEPSEPEPEQEEPEAEAEAEAEGSYDEQAEQAEQAAIDAERNLRTTEPEPEVDDEDDEASLDVEMSQSTSAEKENNQYPTDITGQIFCISGKFTRSKKEIAAAIQNAGGIVSKTLTKKINVLICNPEDTKSKAVAAALKYNLQHEGEEYLTNFY